MFKYLKLSNLKQDELKQNNDSHKSQPKQEDTTTDGWHDCTEKDRKLFICSH
jgi:hypothetical protein